MLILMIHFDLQMPGMTNYTMEGRTYRYMTEEPLYPFGYGLSYTTFKYSSLSVRPEIVRYADDIFVDVYVLNTGKYDGEEVRLQGSQKCIYMSYRYY